MLQRPPAEEPPGVPVYQREAAESGSAAPELEPASAPAQSGAGAPELEPASAPGEAHTAEPAHERPPSDDVSIDSLLKGMDGPVLDDGVNINDLLEDMGKPSV